MLRCSRSIVLAEKRLQASANACIEVPTTREATAAPCRPGYVIVFFRYRTRTAPEKSWAKTAGSSQTRIGNFRLGDADGHHFTISHENGITIQIFRSDGTLHPGRRHELSLWSRTAGPPQGITFGDRFLEIGLWRFADVDGEHFALTQAGGQTAQIFRSDNRLFPGPNAHWTGVFDRYPEYHCGSIHSVFGSCTGLVTNDRFIQLGDWRLADIDGNHFSLSCKTGQTSQVFHRDGAVMTGPRTDLGAWKREAKGLFEAPCGVSETASLSSASGVCGQKANSLSYPTKRGPASKFTSLMAPPLEAPALRRPLPSPAQRPKWEGWPLATASCRLATSAWATWTVRTSPSLTRMGSLRSITAFRWRRSGNFVKRKAAAQSPCKILPRRNAPPLRYTLSDHPGPATGRVQAPLSNGCSNLTAASRCEVACSLVPTRRRCPLSALKALVARGRGRGCRDVGER
eukprot:s2600_g11.t1